MKEMIRFTDVSLKIKEEMILERINLELHDNQIYGFVGKNGSGKTMLFKILCGYVRPTEGKVVVDGRILGKDCDFPDILGAIIEAPGFLPHESGLSNLLYLAKIQNKISKKDVCDWIEKVGLDPKSSKHVGKYSLGMKQRLAIAQALMEQPDIVVLDEPMNALDESGVTLVRDMLLEYKREGRVILVASHNKEDIEILCDKVFEMKNGICTPM